MEASEVAVVVTEVAVAVAVGVATSNPSRELTQALPLAAKSPLIKCMKSCLLLCQRAQGNLLS